MSLLFDYHINFLSDTNNKTEVPFSVFAMTQQGLSHQSQSLGNQDAVCVYVGKNVIIGAVADGCTSGNNLNGKSSNQVGAHLMSYLSVRVARKLILKNHLSLEEIVIPFQQSLISHLKKTLNALSPWKNERTEIIRNFFASTLIILVVTKEQYIIFYCGDGDVFINAEKKHLHNQSGKYFANNLVDLKFNHQSGYFINPEFQFNCLQKGNSLELNNLIVATDGFIDSDVTETPEFNRFFFQQNGTKSNNGFIDKRTDFRRNLLESISAAKNGKIWPADDATFISLKRTYNF